MATKKRKTRKVAGVAKPKVKTKPRKRVSGVTTKRKPKTAIGRVGKAEGIIGKIGKLETKRKKAKVKELRDIIQLEINAEHDKLDALKKAYKKLR